MSLADRKVNRIVFLGILVSMALPCCTPDHLETPSEAQSLSPNMKQADIVPGFVESIRVNPAPSQSRRMAEFVVGLVLIREQSRQDHLPHLLTLLVHSPTRNTLGPPLEVGMYYQFHLVPAGASYRVERYEADRGWHEAEALKLEVGTETFVLTPKDLVEMRDAFTAHLRTNPSSQAASQLLTTIEHTTVSVKEDAASIGSFHVTNRADGLRLEDVGRPASPEGSISFGWTARVERQEGRWVVTAVEASQTKWLREKP